MLIPLGFWAASAGGGAAAGSFDLLEQRVLDSAESSVTFSSLSTYAADYQHLQIRAVARSANTGSNDFLRLRLNGDNTLSNYARHLLVGNGSTVSSFASTGSTFTNIGWIGCSNDAANIFGAHTIDLLDAFETTKNTTVRSLGGGVGTGKEVMLNSILHMNTSAVSSIELATSSGTNLVQYSRFSLYGYGKGA